MNAFCETTNKGLFEDSLFS